MGLISADDPLMKARHTLKSPKEAPAMAIFICDNHVFDCFLIPGYYFLFSLSYQLILTVIGFSLTRPLVYFHVHQVIGQMWASLHF